MLKTTCKYLVLSCIDFRLPNKIRDYLDVRGLKEEYDLHTLPGASLGACCKQYPHWQTTFSDIIGLAQKLHSIDTVIFIDHQDCGAFHNLVDRADDAAGEKQLHANQARLTKDWFTKTYSHLQCEFVYMTMDGEVTPLIS